VNAGWLEVPRLLHGLWQRCDAISPLLRDELQLYGDRVLACLYFTPAFRWPLSEPKFQGRTKGEDGGMLIPGNVYTASVGKTS